MHGTTNPKFLLLCFAKVMFIKIVSKIRRYEFSSVVWLHACSHTTELNSQRRIYTDYFNKHDFRKTQ
jgi:hypothetical protein